MRFEKKEHLIECELSRCHNTGVIMKVFSDDELIFHTSMVRATATYQGTPNALSPSECSNKTGSPSILIRNTARALLDSAGVLTDLSLGLTYMLFCFEIFVPFFICKYKYLQSIYMNH